ncbi:uncharacterized protein LOC142548316 [Primulina tabacum]|uniref:uncharacterized protein LOC142548316 n=1 Tax=Primulina tabacum TaxID=48773 RepID=UPI003F5A6D17
MIHHVLRREQNFKVSIDVVLDEEAEIPIPIKYGPRIVNDAVGAIVGWSKELIIFPTTHKKGKPQLFSLSDVPGQLNKFKHIEKTLPMACKYIYSHVVRLMNESETIYIEFEGAMFGRPKNIWLLREDILRFMEMREIGARKLLVYMGHLYKYLREEDGADYISLVDLGSIPTCPIGKDGHDLSRHIADQLEAMCRDNICLIPFNIGGRFNFSKWVEGEPLAKITEEEVLKFLWKNIVCRFGILRRLISDNGRQFNGKKIMSWCQEMKITQSFTSVAYPQANRQTKVIYSIIVQALKTGLQGKGKD